MVLYFFRLERHNCMKQDTPGVSFSAVFSNSLNKKRRRVLPLSDSLKPDDIGFFQNDAPQAYAIPIKRVKNNWGTRQKWRGKRKFWNRNYSRVGSMSLLNMALFCFRVRVGISHFVFTCLRGFGWSYLTSHLLIATSSWPLIHWCQILPTPLSCRRYVQREVDLWKKPPPLDSS